MKILITTPELNKMGGVANYYRVLRNYLPSNVEYFTACRRTGESVFNVVQRFVGDYSRFKKAISGCDIVHVNPSLGPKAILRDGLFMRASKRHGKKVVVLIHG